MSAASRDLLGLALAAAILLVPAAAAIDLFNPDEPREAEIAREMRASGDALVPHYNGCAFLEKPPLFYWEVFLASKIPGLSAEIEARLPSVLAALGLLFVAYLLGRELYDRRTGRAGAFLLLTTFQFWWLAKRALLDMSLAFFVGAAMLCFLIGHRRPRERLRWFLLAAAAGSGAALTKGLIGLLIPALAIVVYLAWRRELRLLFSPALLAAGAMPAVALGAWVGLLAGRPLGGCFVREFLIENHVKRFLGEGYGGHRQPIWYYVASLATDFQPWVLFLPVALVALWPGWRRPRAMWDSSGSAPGEEGAGASGPGPGGAEGAGASGSVPGMADGSGDRTFSADPSGAGSSQRGLSRGGDGPASPRPFEVNRAEKAQGSADGARAGSSHEPRKGHGRSARVAPDGFLHAWFLPALVLLSAASSKRSIYLLPLAAPVALLVAAWWRGWASRGAAAEPDPRGPATGHPPDMSAHPSAGEALKDRGAADLARGSAERPTGPSRNSHPLPGDHAAGPWRTSMADRMAAAFGRTWSTPARPGTARGPTDPGTRPGPGALVPAWILLALGVFVSLALPCAVAMLLTGRLATSAAGLAALLREAPAGLPLGGALLSAVLGMAILARRRPRRGAAGVVLLAWVLLLVSGAALIPMAEPRVSARAVGEAIRSERDKGVRVAAFRITEGSLAQFLFYSGGTVEWIGRASARPESACTDCREATSAEEFLSGTGPRACLLRQADYERLPARLRRGRVLIRATIGGASYVLVRSSAGS